MKEIWKDIKDYEGYYQVSNFGRIKGLERNIFNGKGYFVKKEKIFKPAINGSGYYSVVLCKNNIQKTKIVHLLVWDYFGDRLRDGIRLQVDHIDGNKLNNRIDNLQLLTQRQNLSKGFLSKRTSSKYTGVCWFALTKKWLARIGINGKTKHLGFFDYESEASEAYKKELEKNY